MATASNRIAPRKLARWVLLAVLIVAGAAFGYREWRHGRQFVSTEDAYVGAHTVDVSAEVAGQVSAVHVENNQAVHAGDALFELDARPFELAVERARAQLELRRAELANAARNETRTRQLVSRGFVSRQGADAAITQHATAAAAVHEAEVALAQAELDLERTHVKAPGDGMVANLSLRPGASVQPRMPLFSLINTQAYWVDANFKETQLRGIRPGQHATVKVDMYPDRRFEGVVESLSGGAGTAFSLLPPQNATGNWVKVTQRVPVRVRVLDPDPARPLRIGTTATVEVRVAG